MELTSNDRMKQSLRGVFSTDFSEIIVDGLNMMHTMEKSMRRIEWCIVALTMLLYAITIVIILTLAAFGISSLCKRFRSKRQRNQLRNDPWTHVLKSDKV